MCIRDSTQGEQNTPTWLPEAEALRLLAEARPDANLSLDTKKALLAAALQAYPTLETRLRLPIESRARDLTDAHKRIRWAMRLRVPELTVEAQWPVDLVGLLILVPVGGAA